ncbi:zinc finger protein ZFP2-like [Elgaria multicarinata webbii]|uniref:zinc finger protein ZFP2-like n=1 Tax=Elgaria multicarinata webbii TaxID=159646 RepID=UPI002FCD5257
MAEENSVDPELAEGQNGKGKATSAVQAAYVTNQSGGGVLHDGKSELSKGLQQRWDTLWQEFQKTMQPSHKAEGSPGRSEAVLWEDAKAFLASFEQVAKACRWPRGEWAARLLPALSGEAEEAFRSLEARDQEDYGKVKAAILRGEALRMEAQRQHFRQFCCQEVRDPRRIHSQVQELCRQWLKPERHSKEQILELLILEQFLASLPVDLQGWIRAGGPDTCSQAVALAEDFLLSQKEAEPGTWQGLMDLKTVTASLHIVERTPSRPGQETMFWQVLQKDGGRVQPVGDGKGGQLKVENTQCGGNKPEEISGTLPERSQRNVPVMEERGNKEKRESEEMHESLAQMYQWDFPETSEIHKQRRDAKRSLIKTESSQQGEMGPEESHGTFAEIPKRNILAAAETHRQGSEAPWQQDENPVKEEEEPSELAEDIAASICLTATAPQREEMPLVSKYGRRYHYRSELLMMHTGEDHHESGESFQKKTYLEKHESPKTGEKENEVSEFMRRDDASGHQSNHAGKKLYDSEGRPYVCFSCGKCFSKSEALTNHQRIHTGVKPYKCSQCGKCFRQRAHLKEHERIHTGVKPYKCSQCGKSFNWRESLMRHQRIHTGEKPYECSQCGKCFRQRQHLIGHQRIHSSCGKYFPKSKALTNHQRIHPGVKLYKCSQCGKCFSDRAQLKKHERIHTGEKPFECLECRKSFSRSGSLLRHQKIHTGEKPFQCPECGKRFFRRDKLIGHQRTHRGQWPYEMPKCGKSFT